MDKETVPNLSGGFDEQTKEILQTNFPISSEEEIYYFDRTPDLKESVIIHYKKGIFSGETRHRFLLLKNIAGLNFEISLSETGYGDGIYQLSFKTQEYDYATTNLGAEENNILFSVIGQFIKNVSELPECNVKEIRISPADASYSTEEINQCMDKVLTSPKNKLSREELISEYNGFRIFDLYRELFGEDFLEKHYNATSRASGRSRYFKIMIKKHFPDWEIDTKFSIGNDFTLKRKL